MDQEECYRWGEIFAEPWDSLTAQMSDRAAAMGLAQEEGDGVLIWRKDSSPCGPASSSGVVARCSFGSGSPERSSDRQCPTRSGM